MTTHTLTPTETFPNGEIFEARVTDAGGWIIGYVRLYDDTRYEALTYGSHAPIKWDFDSAEQAAAFLADHTALPA